jgi:glucose-1-phosphate adenylyltransferase
MIDALGLIFTDGFDVQLDALTERRTVASIPFAGRYRLIDFPLSNLANSGVRNIGIIVKKNYQSLMDHIRGGAEWDLNLRFTGLTFLPPFSSVTSEEPDVYKNRLDALAANTSFLRYHKEKYVIMMGSDFIWNEDLEDFYEAHIASGAKMTALYTKEAFKKNPETESTFVVTDSTGKITRQIISNQKPDGAFYSMNTYIMERAALLELLESRHKTGIRSLRRDVIAKMIENGEANSYEAKGKVFHIDSLEAYLRSSLDMLSRPNRMSLFGNEDRPILTHIMDSAPTKYGKNAKVTNSIIADGAVIEGEVRNCIIFRNVKVEEGAVVENSVIMNDTLISRGAHINYCVLDKNIIIGDDRWLSGYITHPFYSKRSSVI